VNIVKEKKKEEQFRNQRSKPAPINSPGRENNDSKTASNWRNKPPTNLPPRTREEQQSLKPAHQKKQLIQDEDGFFSKGYRNKEVREASEGDQPRPNPTTTTTTKSKKTNTNEKIDDSNIFASLTELND